LLRFDQRPGAPVVAQQLFSEIPESSSRARPLLWVSAMLRPRHRAGRAQQATALQQKTVDAFITFSDDERRPERVTQPPAQPQIRQPLGVLGGRPRAPNDGDVEGRGVPQQP
jgi:hypothetical protein